MHSYAGKKIAIFTIIVQAATSEKSDKEAA